MISPVLITTPRTGSTLICRLLGSIAQQLYGHRGVLFEYFSISPIYKATYGVREGIIVPTGRTMNPSRSNWWGNEDSKRAILHQRLNMLRNNPKHTFKVFPSDIEDSQVFDFVKQQYDFVYLERKDKLSQLLSLMAMVHISKTEFAVNDDAVVEEFAYREEAFEWFVKEVQAYKKIKQQKEGPTIFYEDFMYHGGNQAALATLLQLPNNHLKQYDIKTKLTPYQTSLEDLIVNKQTWNARKPYVLEALQQL